VIRRAARLLPWIGLVAAALGVSSGSPYLVTVGIITALWGILAVGLNLLMGYTGLIHLGLGAFYALGAYGSTILTLEQDWPAWPMLAVMPVVAFVAAAVIGPALLRTRGLHFAVATLGMGIIVSDVTGNWISVTNGPLGIAGIQRPPAILGLDPSRDRDFFVLTVVVLAVCVLLATAYHRSQIARILVAARDDELLASSLGFSILKYRVFAFAASSAMAALAGVLYAWFVRYISPPPFEFFALSFPVFVLVAVGGSGSVWGPVVGAIFLTGIPELMEVEAHVKVIAYGLVLLAVIVLMPKGLVPSLADLWRRVRRRRTPAPSPEPNPEPQPKEVVRL
jgi:branched-chain amino acid transport system permease protein